jgi:hypothetical protein
LHSLLPQSLYGWQQLRCGRSHPLAQIFKLAFRFLTLPQSRAPPRSAIDSGKIHDYKFFPGKVPSLNTYNLAKCRIHLNTVAWAANGVQSTSHKWKKVVWCPSSDAGTTDPRRPTNVSPALVRPGTSATWAGRMVSFLPLSTLVRRNVRNMLGDFSWWMQVSMDIGRESDLEVSS